MRALVLLAATLLLVGCARPAGEDASEDALTFEHDLGEGGIGNGVFAVPDDGALRVVELWFAARDATATHCAAQEPLALRLVAPDGAVHEELRLDAGAANECPEVKREEERLAPGDWLVEATGRGSVVARVRIGVA